MSQNRNYKDADSACPKGPLTLHPGHLQRTLRRQHHLWMKQRTCNPSRNGDQLILPVEELHLFCPGKVGQIHCSSVPDKRRHLIGGCDRRHGGQQLARMHKHLLQSALEVRLRNLLQGVRLRDPNLGHTRPSKRRQMSPTTELPSQIVSYGPHVRSGRYPRSKKGSFAITRRDLKLLDLYRDRRQSNLLLLTR